MFYTVYCTTCLVNGKVYIGCHKTKDPNDSYLGSGAAFSRAVAKYGRKNFKKEVLFIFDNPEEMLAKERELVVVDPEKTYNLDRGGGLNGWGSRPELEVKRISRLGNLARNEKLRKDPSYKEGIQEKARFNLLAWRSDPEWRRNNIRGIQSQEGILKRKEVFKETLHQSGTKNSQYGTCWVNLDGIPRKIPKSELDHYLSLGYLSGRTIKTPKISNGRSKGSPLGTRWMNKDEIQFRVHPEDIQEYLNMGFKFGKLPKETK